MLENVGLAWRKNSPELRGLLNGAFPDFVKSPRPRLPLKGVPVFCFHSVEAAWFERDMQFLERNGYTTIDADQMAAYLTGQASVPDRAVMLTFDDGPRNFFEVAFPLLGKYGQKAVIFIAPALHNDAGDDLDSSWARPMTWSQLLQIHASGLVQIQSHTLESRHVPRWPKPIALDGCHPAVEAARRGTPLPLEDDFRAAREMIEARLPGARVRHIAFPEYDGTDEAMKIAERTGHLSCYWGMLASRPGNLPGMTPFQISRVGGEYLRRLPGNGRVSLMDLLQRRIRVIRRGMQFRGSFGQGLAHQITTQPVSPPSDRTS